MEGGARFIPHFPLLRTTPRVQIPTQGNGSPFRQELDGAGREGLGRDSARFITQPSGPSGVASSCPVAVHRAPTQSGFLEKVGNVKIFLKGRERVLDSARMSESRD